MPITAEAALYAVLKVHAGLGALLGGTGDAMRCFPVEAPTEAALPLVVFQLIARENQTSHGEGDGESRMDGDHFQLSAMAETQLAAASVLYQARLAIEGAGRGWVQIDERAVARSEQANCHGRQADFLIWNDPDAES